MRQLVIVCADQTPPFEKERLGGILLPDQRTIAFSNAKTLLGQEFAYAIYDMRAEGGVCLNLEALAIVAGTIQDGGALYLLCPEWHDLENQLDFDAVRWNANQAIACPNFYRYFKQLIAEFGFEITQQIPLFPQKRDNATQNHNSLTAEQQHILQHLPHFAADIHFITAPRGRGKSTISGKIAEQLAQTHSVLITARSHAALPNFWKGISSDNVTFFAPDQLLQQIDHQQISAQQWLFIDEAASLPLPILQRFCAYFEKVVLTTTTQNYEGTGRGFSLKLLAQVTRSVQQWTLTKPLRWQENDLLEGFINRLLLLDESHSAPACGGQTLAFERRLCRRPEGRAKRVTTLAKQGGRGQQAVKFEIDFANLQKPPSVSLRSTTSPASGGRILLSEKLKFYDLLSAAHYKTTPTDLRRLFDAPDQRFYSIEQNQQLLAVCWAIDEGGLSEALTDAIWRGERRPQGNLVAQYLCFQGNLPAACKLRSVRLSRIAVQPEFQRQGIGKRLVQQIFLQMESTVDFVSVSFGMSDALLNFWQTCGFELVQITPLREASSGYRSAMMLYPFSAAGTHFVQQAKTQFLRDLPLQPFYDEVAENLQKNGRILPLVDWQLYEIDRLNLRAFAEGGRSFSSCYTSLRRLCEAYPDAFSELKQWFDTQQGKFPQNQKSWVEKIRKQIKLFQLL